MGASGEVVLSRPTTRVRWDLSPKQIRQVSEELMGKTKEVYDAVGSMDLESVTFSNTLKALADAELEYTVQWNMLYLIQHVSPSKKVRTASTHAYKKLFEFNVDMRMRKDVYLRVEALSTKVDRGSLTTEDKRYMERQVKLGRGCGRHLPESKQEEIKDIDKHFMNLCIGCKEKKMQNSATLKKLAKLHARSSALLGFKTYADLVLGTYMAKSPEKVSIFLDELAHKLKPLGEEERAILLKLKEKMCQKEGLLFNRKLSERDLRHYKDLVIKNQYGVDHRHLKEYFPLEVVTQGLLDIFQDLLGLSFSLVHGAPVWHPDVTLYCVTDLSARQTVGQFYLDLFTRKGKYEEAACFLLQPSCLLSDGSRQMSVAAIVTNFIKPMINPTLLDHEEVEKYFHEFGHVMHHLCAQVDYAVFSSSEVERDFMEAPSQMLENWVWEKEPLQRMSKHYKTGAPIPDDLLDKLVKSRLANVGMDYLEHIVYAKLDQALYTQTGLDPGKEYARLREEILGVPASQKTNLWRTFGDPADRQQAKHYRYLWSEVLAMDMFYSRFKQEGIMNPKVGMDYRNCILKPGASEDAKEMLKNFLGREPNQEAFLLSKGLTASETRKRKQEECQMKKRKRNEKSAILIM